jgi:hypothetical protein
LDDSGAPVTLRKLQRYRTTSHRNLLKDLAQLRARSRGDSRSESESPVSAQLCESPDSRREVRIHGRFS